MMQVNIGSWIVTNVTTNVVWDVCTGGCECGDRGIWELFVLSAYSFCTHKATLKIMN